MTIVLYSLGSWMIFLFVDFLFFLYSVSQDAAYAGLVLTPDRFTVFFIVLCYGGIGLLAGLCLKGFEIIGKRFSLAEKISWLHLAITLSFALNCLINVVLLYEKRIWPIPFSAHSYLMSALLLMVIILSIWLAITFSRLLHKSPLIAMISIGIAGEVFWSIFREGLFVGGSLRDIFLGGKSIAVVAAALLFSGLVFVGMYFYLPRLITKTGKSVAHFFFWVGACSLLLVSVVETSAAQQSALPCRRPPVVLIILDTVRADHLSSYGYAKKTPAIDAFAAQAVKYNRAYSTASWTLPSIASIMTGIYPLGHGADRLKESDGSAVPMRGLDNRYTTLAEFLNQAGYATAGFISCGFLTNRFGLHQGFDYFDENISSASTIMQTCAVLSFLNIFYPVNDLLASQGHNDRRIAAQVTASAIKWLNRHDRSKPFFMLIHYFDAHHPYFPQKLGMRSVPGSIRNRYARCVNYADVEKQIIDSVMSGQKPLLPDEKEYLMANYDRQIAILDANLDQLFSHLRALNLYDESLIILLSDHGEAFGEHNLMLHGVCLYDNNLHVPLIIKYPRADQKKGAVDNPVSLAGLLPTVLEYLSIPIPDFVQGVPFADDKNQVILAQNIRSAFSPWVLPEPYNGDAFSLMQEDYKLIQFSSGHNRLYYLREDPQEQNNIIARESGVSAALNAGLKSYTAKYAERGLLNKDAQKVDKATLESLRNLGYIQ